MAHKRRKVAYHLLGAAVLVALLVAVSIVGASLFPVTYNTNATEGGDASPATSTDATSTSAASDSATSTADIPRHPPAIYIDTPEQVKALYMTQCVAGTPSFRRQLVNMVRETEINSLIIDIKDYTGMLAFEPRDPDLKKYFGEHCYARDMRSFIRSLNDEGIYVIGRITVFQDPRWAEDHPELAVQTESTGGIWSDKKGLHYVDVGAKPFWKYIMKISREAKEVGFDELNYDYIRFPSDGNMQDIHFPVSGARMNGNPAFQKEDAVREFWAYLYKNTRDLGIPTSADLFGMVTTNRDDLNIGQILEYALPYFDYVAPMVYPSHYPPGFNGWSNPNDYPHEVIEYSMTSAVRRTRAYANATSTPEAIRKRVSPDQLRAWIQDFDYGGDYGISEVRAQIEAVYDSGLDSWMVWDPANRYTRGAYRPTGESQ